MTLLALIAITLGGAAIASLAWAFAIPRTRADARLREIDSYGYEAAVEAPGAAPAAPSMGLAHGLGRLFEQRFGEESREKLRLELVAAGLYNTEPHVLLGYRVLAVVVLGFLGVISEPLLILTGPILDTVVLGAIGWIVPVVYVRRRARYRLDRVDRGVPDLIDLLVVMIEAGSGFAGAMGAAASRTHGPLGDELRITLQEQRFGLALDEAMKNMAVRADVPNMRSFVRAVTQGETLGVSIGTIMRNLSVEMRVRRRQSAEERAQKAPVKMLFPLVFLILPALLIVLLAPAIFEISDVLGG